MTHHSRGLSYYLYNAFLKRNKVATLYELFQTFWYLSKSESKELGWLCLYHYQSKYPAVTLRICRRCFIIIADDISRCVFQHIYLQRHLQSFWSIAHGCVLIYFWFKKLPNFLFCIAFRLFRWLCNMVK